MSNIPGKLDNITHLQNKVFNHTTNAWDVSIQDQHTDAIIVLFNKVINSTFLSSVATIDSSIIEVDDASGITIGTYIILFNPYLIRFSTFFVTDLTGNTIQLDSALDVEYPSGSTFVDVATVELNVDGSSTHQVFGIRGTSVAPDSIPIEVDLTRIILQGITDTLPTYGLFGDLPILKYGVFLRKRDGRYKNILNWKSNDDIANTMYDFDILSATNPAQGVNGFKSRLTFGGQSKVGVVIRLDAGEDLEIHIQDDLSDLLSFRIMAEGHIVD